MKRSEKLALPNVLPDAAHTPHGYTGEVSRTDHGGELLALPGDWREGACSCACPVSRGPDGALVRGDACSCSRVVDLSDDPERGLKVSVEPCNPNESYPAMTINRRPGPEQRTDSEDPVDVARKRRDDLMATAWRAEDPKLGPPPAVRTDAIEVNALDVDAARKRRDDSARDAWKPR